MTHFVGKVDGAADVAGRIMIDVAGYIADVAG